MKTLQVSRQFFESMCEAECWSKHHTSTIAGYVSRRTPSDTVLYDYYVGRFGRGVKVYHPRWDTTSYCYVTYYVKSATSEKKGE